MPLMPSIDAPMQLSGAESVPSVHSAETTRTAATAPSLTRGSVASRFCIRWLTTTGSPFLNAWIVICGPVPMVSFTRLACSDWMIEPTKTIAEMPTAMPRMISAVWTGALRRNRVAMRKDSIG